MKYQVKLFVYYQVPLTIEADTEEEAIRKAYKKPLDMTKVSISKVDTISVTTNNGKGQTLIFNSKQVKEIRK